MRRQPALWENGLTGEHGEAALRAYALASVALAGPIDESGPFSGVRQ